MKVQGWGKHMFTCQAKASNTPSIVATRALCAAFCDCAYAIARAIKIPFISPAMAGVTGVLAQALLISNFESTVVSLCVQKEHMFSDACFLLSTCLILRWVKCLEKMNEVMKC